MATAATWEECVGESSMQVQESCAQIRASSKRSLDASLRLHDSASGLKEAAPPHKRNVYLNKKKLHDY